jgi:hypothetical protein
MTDAKPYTTEVDLTDEELLLLDGHASQNVQTAIDGAKLRSSLTAKYGTALTTRQIAMLQKALAWARAQKLLVSRHENLEHCQACGTSKRYVTYKSGPRKGEPNYDRPILVNGVEHGDGFISMRGYPRVGWCNACEDVLLPYLKTECATIACQTPWSKRWTRYGNRRCTSCGWSGHEGQMGHSLTMFGNGTYPSSCPACKASNQIFGATVIETADGYTVVENVEAPLSS